MLLRFVSEKECNAPVGPLLRPPILWCVHEGVWSGGTRPPDVCVCVCVCVRRCGMVCHGRVWVPVHTCVPSLRRRPVRCSLPVVCTSFFLCMGCP